MEDQRSTNARVIPLWLRGLELLLSGDATLIWGLLFSAWGTVFIAVLTGNGNWLHADALTAHPYWGIGANALTFIFAWLVMTLAMMLPTSLPLIQLFAKVDSRPWLIQHSSWFTGITLLLAGAFQFSGLKERCLRVCRHPYGFLSQHYRRGTRAAWELGFRHGLYCLGCCWALMLVMFSVGVAHLAGMLVLTAVMAIEKTSRWGRTLVPVFGVILLSLGRPYPGLGRRSDSNSHQFPLLRLVSLDMN
jgi:predicted metal-binding membrane protein